jgi:probable HAF family extracellular repeat protein
MKDLGTLGGQSSDARAINASGQVTGESLTSGGSNDGFLYTGGVMTDLGTLGGTDTRGIALNDGGEVVGYSELKNGDYDAFLYMSGTIYDLNSLVVSGLPAGATLEEGDGINNSGWIIAEGTDSRAYLLEPVPEPSALVAFGLLVGVVTRTAIRRLHRSV